MASRFSFPLLREIQLRGQCTELILRLCQLLRPFIDAALQFVRELCEPCFGPLAVGDVREGRDRALNVALRVFERGKIHQHGEADDVPFTAAGHRLAYVIHIGGWNEYCTNVE